MKPFKYRCPYATKSIWTNGVGRVSRKFLMMLLLVILVFAFTGCVQKTTPEEPGDQPLPLSRSGLRVSSYGVGEPFPGTDYWSNTSRSMASRFQGATPALIWIVGIMQFSRRGNATGRTVLNFPAPDSTSSFPNIVFSATDENREYLEAFDQEGIQVWLQVEPANADIATLIQLVLDRYAVHPCVVGFGVDVEWFKWTSNNQEGTAITDNEAQAWSQLVRSYNPEYLLFLKHWLTSKMPPFYREGIMFLDDSQQFRSLNRMVNEFAEWGATFAPAPVGFQYGYSVDQVWWGNLADPPGDIGQEILNRIPNTTELYWVDFTMTQIWPYSGNF
jgi:hypothetical protein